MLRRQKGTILTRELAPEKGPLPPFLLSTHKTDDRKRGRQFTGGENTGGPSPESVSPRKV